MLQNCHTHTHSSSAGAIVHSAYRFSLLNIAQSTHVGSFSLYICGLRLRHCYAWQELRLFRLLQPYAKLQHGRTKSARKTSRFSGYRAHPPPPVLLQMGICSERALRFFHLGQPAKEHLHPLGGEGGLHRCLSFQCISHKPAD